MERLKKKLRDSGLSEASTRYYLGLVGSTFNKAVSWNLFEGESPLKAAMASNRKFAKIAEALGVKQGSAEEKAHSAIEMVE